MNKWLRLALGGILALTILCAGLAVSLGPCPRLPYVHPLPIRAASPFYVTTDRGRLFPGQTYRYFNEGPWVGSVTLLLAWKDGALVLVAYPKGQWRSVCWDTFP